MVPLNQSLGFDTTKSLDFEGFLHSWDQKCRVYYLVIGAKGKLISCIARAVVSVLGSGSASQPIQVFIGNEQLDEYVIQGQRRRLLQTNGANA
jgi:hypothetical protein